MSDNLYIMYLKHISEGDASAGQESAISPQLKNLINNASTGKNGATKCMSFLNKKYGIKDVNSFCNFIKKLFKSATGAAGKLLAKIWSGIQAAMRWALKLIKKSKSINAREDLYVNGKPDYGSNGMHIAFDVVAVNLSHYFAVICGAIISVLYKVRGKVDFSTDPYAIDYTKRTGKYVLGRFNPNINESIIESKAMFSDLDQLIESSHLSEGPEIRKFIDSYIQKMQPKVMELWGKIDTIARSNKILAIVIAVCAACIFSYMGLKKALGNRKQKKVALA